LPCIAAKGLTFKVKGKVIVEDVSAELCGGLNVVLGPNGAGKTTLLRLFAGVLRPTQGSVLIDGAPPDKVRARISYVPAQLSLDPMTRVVDLAEAINYGKDGSWRKRLREYLSALGIEWAAERRFSTLSSGEQRLATIAAALSRGGDVIIADEPTEFLDVSNRAKVFALFRGLVNKGALVIIATHDVRRAGQADRVLVLSRGVVTFAGQPGEGLVEALSKAYSVDAKTLLEEA